MMEIIAISLVLLTTLLVSLYAFFKQSYKYWENKNIPFEKPVIPFGSYPINNKVAFGIMIRRQYQAAKEAGLKECGMFILWRPVYFPIDPQIIKHILSVDFHSFVDRGVYYNKKTDPLSAHLFSLPSQQWKTLRAKLTPAFTSGKMKMMFECVVKCGQQLNKSMDHLASLNEPIDILDISCKFTADVIGSCAFGIDCNSFENPNSEFKKSIHQFLKISTFRKIKAFFSFMFPKFSKKVGLTFTHKDTTKFFLRIVRELVEYREENKIVRNDFMQLLLNLKNEQGVDGMHHLSLEEIAAQAFLFFAAGFETSSFAKSLFLYEMSRNPEIQERVREEINSVLGKYGGEVTYDSVMDMKYMKQAFDETLRKYPSAPFLIRQSTENYKMPGRDEILEKGTLVLIPSYGLHYDPEYFPDPEKFDPERFSDENKDRINPYTYLPFGEGPKNCIGWRFGEMQVKVGLIYLLQNYTFSLNEKTNSPLEMDPASIPLQILGGIWLNVTKV